MKLKYYLRGLGLGIIFTTIVLLISFHTREVNISDEEIIKRAGKLGMVMKEEESLFPMDGEEDTSDEEEPVTEKEGDIPAAGIEDDNTEPVVPVDTAAKNKKEGENTGSEQENEGNQNKAESPEDAETPGASGEPAASGESVTPEKTKEPDATTDSEEPAASTQTEKKQDYVESRIVGDDVVFTIEKGDGCRLLAEALQREGIIEDSEDFRKYMDQRNLDNKIRVGEFRIPMDATYEEIAKIIAN